MLNVVTDATSHGPLHPWLSSAGPESYQAWVSRWLLAWGAAVTWCQLIYESPTNSFTCSVDVQWCYLMLPNISFLPLLSMALSADAKYTLNQGWITHPSIHISISYTHFSLRVAGVFHQTWPKDQLMFYLNCTAIYLFIFSPQQLVIITD